MTDELPNKLPKIFFGNFLNCLLNTLQNPILSLPLSPYGWCESVIGAFPPWIRKFEVFFHFVILKIDSFYLLWLSEFLKKIFETWTSYLKIWKIEKLKNFGVGPKILMSKSFCRRKFWASKNFDTAFKFILKQHSKIRVVVSRELKWFNLLNFWI